MNTLTPDPVATAATTDRPALLVIRPYGDWIRKHIFAILNGAGIPSEPAEAIAGDADDDEVVRIWQNRRPRALLVPFHAKRDREERDGFRSGVSALATLRRSSQQPLLVPIVMPISEFGYLGFHGIIDRQTQKFQEWFNEHVCLLMGPFEDHEPHMQVIRQYVATRPRM